MRFLIAAAVCCGATATLEITRATRRTRLPATTAHAREARVTPPPPPPPPSPWPADAESLVMERRRPKHWKACALTVAVVSLARVAAFGCPCALASAARRFLDVDCENRRARVVAFLIAAVAYVLEAARSSSLRYVRDVRSAEEVDGFLRDALDAAPAVAWAASSYHYERRRSGAHAESSRRVVTSVHRDDWRYGAWRDASGGLDFLAARWRDACSAGGTAARPSLVKIRLRKALVFDDIATGDDYHAQLASFARAHRHRDVHLALEQDFDLAGWDADERMLGVRRPLGAPGRLWTPAGFWIATSLGLTVPYRGLLERRCAVSTLEVVKRVRSLRPEAPPG